MSSQLTDVQNAAIEIVPRCMAGLSVCGSACVLWTVFWNQRNAKGHQQQGRRRPASAPQNQYQHQSNHRTTPKRQPREPLSQVAGNLLICLSMMDMLSSLTYVFGSVMFPTENGGKGNQATCNAQGFFCNLQVGAALYSGFLPWYYYLVLKLARKPNGLLVRRRYEIFVHAFCWSFVVATGVVAIAKGLYNPHWVRCYISGPNTGKYVWGFFYAPIWASMINGFMAMVMIYRFVRKTESKTNRWSPLYQIYNQSRKENASGDGSSDIFDLQANMKTADVTDQEVPVGGPREDNVIATEKQSSTKNAIDGRPASMRRISFRSENILPRPNLPRTRRVFYQALGYSSAFFFVYLFPTTSRIIQTIGNTPPYWIRLLAVTFISSQGAFNWIVYFFLPRFMNWRICRNRHRDDRGNSSNDGGQVSHKSRNSLMSAEFKPAMHKIPEVPPNLSDRDINDRSCGAGTDSTVINVQESAPGPGGTIITQ
mmetsp:Transcript_62530/g.152241  ORF Transcript_62530/g.152241 Transcript_62530/m.152241 type:complete len:482 (+) Transcript_62530:228-1673(+)